MMLSKQYNNALGTVFKRPKNADDDKQKYKQKMMWMLSWSNSICGEERETEFTFQVNYPPSEQYGLSCIQLRMVVTD